MLDALVAQGWHKDLDKLAGSAMSEDHQIIMFLKGGNEILKTASPERLSRWVEKVLSSEPHPRLQMALAQYLVKVKPPLDKWVLPRVVSASRTMRDIPGNVVLSALPETWLAKNQIELRNFRLF